MKHLTLHISRAFFVSTPIFPAFIRPVNSPSQPLAVAKKALIAFITLGLFFCFSVSFAFAQNKQPDNEPSFSLYLGIVDYSSNIGNGLKVEGDSLTFGGVYHPIGANQPGFYAVFTSYDEGDISVTDGTVSVVISGLGINFDGTLLTAGVTTPITPFDENQEISWRAFGGLAYTRQEASYTLRGRRVTLEDDDIGLTFGGELFYKRLSVKVAYEAEDAISYGLGVTFSTD